MATCAQRRTVAPKRLLVKANKHPLEASRHTGSNVLERLERTPHYRTTRNNESVSASTRSTNGHPRYVRGAMMVQARERENEPRERASIVSAWNP